MKRRVKDYIAQQHMVTAGDKILVGLSGGADSVCLLLLLQELKEELQISLEAVHVEHGIRGEESLQDAAFSAALCERLGIICHMKQVDALGEAKRSGRSLEEAARLLRYEAYEEVCQEHGIRVIALAHHGDDNAETMLFHLTRGTGLRGLGGISPVREDEAGNRIIRPLLCVTKDEILRWLQDENQTYCEDSTNEDQEYSRNRIRHSVLPELQQINAQAVEHMNQTGAMLHEISDYLDEMADLEGASCISKKEPLTLSIDMLEKMHPVLQKIYLLKQLGTVAGSKKDLTARHVESLLGLMQGTTGSAVMLPYEMTARREYGHLILERNREVEEMAFVAQVLTIPGTVKLNHSAYLPETHAEWESISLETAMLPYDRESMEIPENQYTKWFDYDKIMGTVQIRTRETGDYLQVDERGNHKKIKRYFIDEKIPAGKRDTVWMVADGSHIMWILGGRISEAYKVTDETRRILQIQLSIPEISGNEM